jgi:electron transport complex protein RnfC
LAARLTGEIVGGVELLREITHSRRAMIAIEADGTADWVKPIRSAIKQTDLRLVELANDYPQADPTLILFSLASRRLVPGHLPPEQGVLLIDAATAAAVGAARRGERMLRVPMAIHDHLSHQSHFLSAPVGSTLDHVLERCGIADEQIILRAGDLLRDRRISAEAIIAGGEVTIHASAMELPANPDPCIRCSWCITICPTRVQPAKILEAVQHNDRSIAKSAGIHACIECGLCSHVCPARLPLLDAVRLMRAGGKD